MEGGGDGLGNGQNEVVGEDDENKDDDEYYDVDEAQVCTPI